MQYTPTQNSAEYEKRIKDLEALKENLEKQIVGLKERVSSLKLRVSDLELQVIDTNQELRLWSMDSERGEWLWAVTRNILLIAALVACALWCFATAVGNLLR